MNLAIERFATRCRASRRAGIECGWIERLVRERLSGECARRLANWPESDAVVRIRSLRVVLPLSAADLDPQRCAERWAAALAAALTEALGRGGAEVVRVGSRAEWLARFLANAVAGTAETQWEYAEFRDAPAHGAASVALAALESHAADAPSALALLAVRGRFESFLALFDEPGLTRLCTLLSPAGDAASSSDTPDPALLVVVARAMLRHAPPRRGQQFASRARALRLFLALRIEEPASPWAAEELHHMLTAIETLLESRATPSGLAAGSLPAPAALLLARARLWLDAGHAGPPAGSGGAALREVLDQIREHLGSPHDAAGADEAPWIGSEVAGLLLLIPRVQLLGWRERVLGSRLAGERGPGMLAHVFAGIALCVLGRSAEEVERRLDPAVALFASWTEEPDRVAWRDFHASGSVADRAELLHALLDEDAAPAGAVDSWTGVFDALADSLVRDFAAQLRGFREKGRPFIVEHFLAIPGRLRLTEKEIVVAIAANPFNVVLHLAGMDCRVPSVSWLGGRQVEFQFDGL